MASTLKSPGVYVEEISTFPPSVAQVPTAIPAFIGYTAKQGLNDDLGMKPKKIRSLLEFELLYGGGPEGGLTVVLDTNNSVKDVTAGEKMYLYDSLKLFYDNGGGDCYIVSIGTYGGGITKQNFIDGINALKKFDEPTLYVTPDASLLKSIDDFKDVHSTMLDECEILQDRFAILDVYKGDIDFTDPLASDVIGDYRNKIPSNSNLKYGGCYYPFLRTSLPLSFNFSDLSLTKNAVSVAFNTIIDESKFSDGKKDVLTKIEEASTDYKATKIIVTDHTATLYSEATGGDQKAELDAKIALINDYFSDFFGATMTNADILATYNTVVANDAPFSNVNKAFADGITAINSKLKASDKVVAAATTVTSTATTATFTVDVSGIAGTSNTIDKLYGIAKPFFQQVFDELNKIISDFYTETGTALKSLEDTLKAESPLYSSILTGIKQYGVVLPPSGAIAGVYAKVDNLRGVWKAPANVGLNSVNEPVVKLSSKDQEGLNIDEVAGKSINVIRAFTGKGNLVWGARTMAGNDNEWRYVPVRRFFNMVEESVKKATEQFVFEPNDANTWVRIRSMIENFLTNQWRAGALAGAKTEEAFFVRVGLGQTMTAQDILNGVLNVEIGMAAVRPAEFIVLKFSHKLQES
ncbi:phage tail sheath C-terminal domain-containing protein [Aquimarina sp. RZ0]|uniref:phage tail sheath family protein n=1 Tax=Aquimarina sp. RZ0 TaxID=2607730 RepID=UPI0011F31AB9|nr:phage tail sheath C-terminal domain-containing protein [Aquimarina sp. RZ0]KAA1248058.1 phage tail sheath family protein [Aquimarina sp. RZ0]